MTSLLRMVELQITKNCHHAQKQGKCTWRQFKNVRKYHDTSIFSDIYVIRGKVMNKRKKKCKRGKKTTLKKDARLQSGKEWIKTYSGNHIIKGYKKKYKVNTISALKELQSLGVEFDQEYVKKVVESENSRLAAIKRRNEKRKEEELLAIDDSDDTFSFIAGYTSGGAPYGTRWDEEEVEQENYEYDDDDLPF